MAVYSGTQNGAESGMQLLEGPFFNFLGKLQTQLLCNVMVLN